MTWAGSGSSEAKSIFYTHDGVPVTVLIIGSYIEENTYNTALYLGISFNGSTVVYPTALLGVNSGEFNNTITCTANINKSAKLINIIGNVADKAKHNYSAIFYFQN